MASNVSVAPLQAALVDLIDLALQGKQAHWNVQGPHFRSVHLQLDEVIDDLRLWSDDVAERIAAVGDYPDGRARAVVDNSKVDGLDAGALGTDKVVRLFEERLTAASQRIKDVLPDLDEDMVSQDLLVEVSGGLDKHAWMFRATLGE